MGAQRHGIPGEFDVPSTNVRLMAVTMRVPAPRVRPPTRVTNSAAIVPVCALFIIVYWSYKTQVYPTYAYEGYRFRDPDPAWLFAGLVLSLLPLFWLPTQPRRPSAVTLWIIYLFVVVPICCLTPALPMRSERWMFGVSIWSVMFLAIASLSQLPKVVSLPRLHLAPRRARALVSIGSVGTFLLLIAKFGFTIGSPDLSIIYTQRLSFRTILETSNPAYGYLVDWSQVVLAPLAVAVALRRRSAVWMALGTSILVWAYFVTATRQALVAIPFAFALYWAGNRRVSGASYAVGGVSLIAVSSAAFALTGNLYALGSISERLFAVPGVLGGYYFDYFANRPPVLLRDGVGGFLSASPYPREMTFQIGLEYLGRVEANANVNVIADAFANFWLAGLVVAFVLACLLWLLDAVTIRLPLGPTMASLVLVLLAFLNVGLTVAVLTSGFGLIIAMLWLFGDGLFEAADHDVRVLVRGCGPSSDRP